MLLVLDAKVTWPLLQKKKIDTTYLRWQQTWLAIQEQKNDQELVTIFHFSSIEARYVIYNSEVQSNRPGIRGTH